MINLGSSKNFTPLREHNGNYSVSSKKPFKPTVDASEYSKECIDFSYEMVWGSGHFKESGRDKSSIFKDSLKGKIGEFALYKHLTKLGYEIPYPDLSVHGYGISDDGDLFLEGRKLSVKTTYYFSDLLLLKKNEWDENGGYLYGKDGVDPEYKAFFLCRMRPNLDDILSIKGNENPGIDNLYKMLEHVSFRVDLSGFISIDDFKKIIRDKIYIRSGSIIGKREFSEDFYYCQSGDLRSIDDIKRKK